MGAPLPGPIGCAQLLLEDRGGRQAPEQVPVERAIGGEGHVGHQLDAVVGDLAHGRDELQGGALVVPNGPGQGEQLGVTGSPRRHRLAVAVGVGLAERRRHAQGAGGHGVVGQGDHGRDVACGRRLADRGPAHGQAPDGGVADEKAGVDCHPSVELVEPLAEGAPVPARAALQGGQGHAFDPRHHAHHVVGALVVEGCDREAAVAAEHGGDTVQRRRARGRVPEQLGVIVGVDVDEPRRDDQPGHVDAPGGRLVGRADGDDAAVADSHVAPAGRRAGPVDDVSAHEQQVEHRHASDLMPRRRSTGRPASGGAHVTGSAPRGVIRGRPVQRLIRGGPVQKPGGEHREGPLGQAVPEPLPVGSHVVVVAGARGARRATRPGWRGTGSAPGGWHRSGRGCRGRGRRERRSGPAPGRSCRGSSSSARRGPSRLVRAATRPSWTDSVIGPATRSWELPLAIIGRGSSNRWRTNRAISRRSPSGSPAKPRSSSVRWPGRPRPW